MKIASLVIGCVTILLSFIPCLGWFAILPAVVGIILGVLAFKQARKNNQPKGMPIAGIVLNIVSILFVCVFTTLVYSSSTTASKEKGSTTASEEVGTKLENKISLEEMEKEWEREIDKAMQELQ